MKTTHETEVNGFIIKVKYNEQNGKHFLIVDDGYVVVVPRKRQLGAKFEALKVLLNKTSRKVAA